MPGNTSSVSSIQPKARTIKAYFLCSDPQKRLQSQVFLRFADPQPSPDHCWRSAVWADDLLDVASECEKQALQIVDQLVAACIADPRCEAIPDTDLAGLRALALKHFLRSPAARAFNLERILLCAANEQCRAPFITDLLNADHTYNYFNEQNPQAVRVPSGSENRHAFFAFLETQAPFLWKHVRSDLHKKLTAFSLATHRELIDQFRTYLLAWNLSDADFLFELTSFFDYRMRYGIGPIWPVYFLQGKKADLVNGEYEIGDTPIEWASRNFLSAVGQKTNGSRRLLLLIQKIQEFCETQAGSSSQFSINLQLPKIFPRDVLIRPLKDGQFAEYLPDFVRSLCEQFPEVPEEKARPESNLFAAFFKGIAALDGVAPQQMHTRMAEAEATLAALIEHQTIPLDNESWPEARSFADTDSHSTYLYFQAYSMIWRLFLDQKIDTAECSVLLKAWEPLWPEEKSHFHTYLFLKAVELGCVRRNTPAFAELEIEIARVSNALHAEKTAQGKTWEMFFNEKTGTFQAPNIHAKKKDALPTYPDAAQYATILHTAKTQLVTQFLDPSSKQVARTLAASAYLDAIQYSSHGTVSIARARDAFLDDCLFLKIGNFRIYKTNACAKALNDACHGVQPIIVNAARSDLYQALYYNQLANKTIIKMLVFALFVAPIVWLFRKIYGAVEAVEIAAPVTRASAEAGTDHASSAGLAVPKHRFLSPGTSLGYIEEKSDGGAACIRFFGLRDDVAAARHALTVQDSTLSARSFNHFCNQR